MKKENKDVTSSKWRQLFRKRWFFPAIYITIAALLLTLVVWYQNLDNKVPRIDQEALEVSDHYVPVNQSGEGDPVIEQKESILKPVSNDTEIEIVTKYYDYDTEASEQEKALILFDNHYYQSTGIDLARTDGETFDVLASLSGTVSTVKDDPILGTVVIIDHEDGVETYYSSLADVNVQEGMKVNQGDVIGKAGKNVFGKDNGIHVHFEIRKNNVTFNPENYFNESVADLMVAEQDVGNEQNEQDEIDEQNEEGNSNREDEL